MKWIKWAILGVIVLVISGALIVWANLNGIVRRTVQTQASASLNLPTTVGGARVSLLGGNVSLSDVQIASPQGYAAPHMFTLGGTSVGASWGGLRSDPVLIDRITINRPWLVIEQRDGRFNLQVLMDLVEQMPPDDDPLRLIINELTVSDAQVALRPGIPGLAQEIAIPIPSFTVHNIGTDDDAQNGAAIKEVTMLLVTTMAAKAAESDQLPPEVQLLLKGNVAELARDMANEYGGKALEELKRNLPPEVGGAVGDLLDATRTGEDPKKAIEQRLGGLLGRDRDRPPATQPQEAAPR
jgi:hypothetical protein